MSHQDVETALNKVRTFFLEVQEHIDAMKVGDKVPATKLADAIARRHDMTGPQLYPVLKFFFDTCTELNVKRGAHGGLFKIVPGTETKVEAVEPATTEGQSTQGA